MIPIKLFLVLAIFGLVITQQAQQCIMGVNCPLNQGFCIDNQCQCLEGFKTYFDKSIPFENQVYCNYQQKSHFVPLVLECFLPGIGHFYVGKYLFGAIKLCICLAFLCSTFYIYKELKIPKFIIALKEQILPGGIFDDFIKSGRPNNLFKVARLVFNLSFYPFWLFWAGDLYLYFTNYYYDGYGMPLV